MTQQRSARPNFRGPLYAQVAQAIRSDISNGRWKVGSVLPSELDMARSFDVSVGTMRKAMAMLTDDKMIRRSRGRGTEIIAAQPQARLSVLDYGSEFPPADEVTIAEKPVQPEVAEKLQLSLSDVVTVLERLNVFDDKSRALDWLFLPCAIYDEVRHVDIYSNEKLEDAYQALDPLKSLRAKEWIIADHADTLASKKLQVSEGTQILKVTRLLTLGDTPVEYSERFINIDGVAYSLRHRAED